MTPSKSDIIYVCEEHSISTLLRHCLCKYAYELMWRKQTW